LMCKVRTGDGRRETGDGILNIEFWMLNAEVWINDWRLTIFDFLKFWQQLHSMIKTNIEYPISNFERWMLKFGLTIED
jgi:hypothetical protein